MDNSITIVMITFNGEKFFQEQVESILNQTNDSFNLYIQDDHSNSSFQTTLKGLNQPNVEINILNENVGILKNIKSAILKNRTAQYIALSDQDDIWDKDKLNRILEEIAQHQDKPDSPLMVYHDAEVIDENGYMLYPSFWKLLGHDGYEHRLETFLFGNFVTGGTMVFNQSLAKHAEDIPEDLNTLHDAWLSLYAFVFGDVIRIDQKLNKYRHHETNAAFDRSPKKESKSVVKKVKNWLFEKDYLKDEFAIIERFLIAYENQIPQKKRIILNAFLKLKGQPTWYKKLQRYLVLRRFRSC